jgi:hypothetical protein
MPERSETAINWAAQGSGICASNLGLTLTHLSLDGGRSKESRHTQQEKRDGLAESKALALCRVSPLRMNVW